MVRSSNKMTCIKYLKFRKRGSMFRVGDSVMCKLNPDSKYCEEFGVVLSVKPSEIDEARYVTVQKANGYRHMFNETKIKEWEASPICVLVPSEQESYKITHGVIPELEYEVGDKFSPNLATASMPWEYVIIKKHNEDHYEIQGSGYLVQIIHSRLISCKLLNGEWHRIAAEKKMEQSDDCEDISGWNPDFDSAGE
jgi:hypothetical protein